MSISQYSTLSTSVFASPRAIVPVVLDINC
jgi:hypothetical protein